MPPKRPTAQEIALRGSAANIADYLRYAIYSILFLRGVYAIEDFMIINKYDLELLIATNEELETYVATVLSQAEQWLSVNQVRQLVLVIVSKESKETIERWVFDVEVLRGNEPSQAPEEPHKDIHLMLAGIRGTNSMLSEIEEPTVCNILIYIKDDGDMRSATPPGWKAASTYPIEQDFASEVKLKQASASFHKIQATVVYRD